jgi:acetyltransferase-like isoleucine patch superfamily enzyme
MNIYKAIIILFDLIPLVSFLARYAVYKSLFRGRVSIAGLYHPRLKIIMRSGEACLEVSERFSQRGGSINITSGFLKIGKEVFINSGYSINVQKQVEIGDKTIIGHNCFIIDHDHVFDNGEVSRNEFTALPISIGRNVWIGANVLILKGITIGDGAVIAAGSIVTKNVDPHSVFLQKRSLC